MKFLLVFTCLIFSVATSRRAPEQDVNIFVENENVDSFPKGIQLRLFLFSQSHPARIFDFKNLPPMQERYKAQVSIRGHIMWNFFLVSPGTTNTILCTMNGRSRTVVFTDEKIKKITVTLRKGEPGGRNQLSCIMTPTWNLEEEEGERYD